MKARNDFRSFKEYKEYLRVYCTVKFTEASILIDGVSDDEELINICVKFGDNFVNKLFNETTNNNRSNSNNSITNIDNIN